MANVAPDERLNKRLELKKRLKELISKASGGSVSVSEIGNRTPLMNLRVDSVTALEVVVALEMEFGVSITDLETAMEAFVNIESLADFIEQEMKAFNEKLKGIICEVLGRQASDIDAQTPLNEPKWDTIMLHNMATKLESEFKITIQDIATVLERYPSLESLANFIQNKMKAFVSLKIKLKEIFSDALGENVPKSSIDDRTSFKDFKWNKEAVHKVVTRVKSEFGIVIPDKETGIIAFTNIESLANFIEAKPKDSLVTFKI